MVNYNGANKPNDTKTNTGNQKVLNEFKKIKQAARGLVDFETNYTPLQQSDIDVIKKKLNALVVLAKNARTISLTIAMIGLLVAIPINFVIGGYIGKLVSVLTLIGWLWFTLDVSRKSNLCFDYIERTEELLGKIDNGLMDDLVEVVEGEFSDAAKEYLRKILLVRPIDEILYGEFFAIAKLHSEAAKKAEPSREELCARISGAISKA